MCSRCQRRYREGKPLNCAECEETANRQVEPTSRASTIPGAIQPKLEVSDPTDEYEREAERVAESVSRAAHSTAASNAGDGPSCSDCEDSPRIRRTTPAGGYASASASDSPVAGGSRGGATEHTPDGPVAHVTDVLQEPGRALEATTRRQMETHFGRDFGSVRVHTGRRAAESARTVSARAYTVGTDVVFGANEYSPATEPGQKLLAHELTHVVQQTPGAARTIYRSDKEETDSRGSVDEEGEANPMTREEEIRRSRTSPGQAALQFGPGAVSLYNFAIDSDRPKEYHRELLSELAQFLQRDLPVPMRIRVVGHASSPGPFGHNEDLARRRAEAVVAVLEGAGLSDVGTMSAGESNPVASNETVEGRSRNRRVDVRLFPGRIPSPEEIPDEPEPEPDRPGPDEDWCDRYPKLCDLGPIPTPILIPWPPLWIPIPIPIPWPLLCLLAPELCALLPCVLNPALCIPRPPPEPDGPDGPDEPDEPEEEDSFPSVEFTLVRADNTPDAMGDRIPDQGSTAVMAFVTGPRRPIQIVRANANPATGSFTIDGGTETTISGTTTLDVAGTRQTTTAAASFPLQLRALVDGVEVGRSDPFAVAAIMENMATALEDVEVVWSHPDPRERGVRLVSKMTWESDGAAGHRSLDQIRWDERLEVQRETGGMVGLGPLTHGFENVGDIHPVNDRHGTEARWMRRPASQELFQLYVMTHNDRTGEAEREMVITRSGFTIIRRVEPDPNRLGCYQFVVSKVGAAGTAQGLSSAAGAGSAKPGPVPIPCDRGGGGDTDEPELLDPDSDIDDGTTPATETTPRPHKGPIPPGKTPFSFVSISSQSFFVGQPLTLTIAFVGAPAAGTGREPQVFVTTLMCFVQDFNDEAVRLRTANPMPVNVAPEGYNPTVMPAGKLILIPRSLIE